MYVPASNVGTVQVAVAELADPDKAVEPPLVHDSTALSGSVTDHVIAPDGVAALAGPDTVTVNVPDPPKAGADAGAATLILGVAAATVVVAALLVAVL